MRRTETVARAPSFNSLRRIEPAVALASAVPGSAMRRRLSTRTWASEANQSRIWLARSFAASRWRLQVM